VTANTETQLLNHVIDMKSDIAAIKQNTEAAKERLDDYSKRIRRLEWYAGIIVGIVGLLTWLTETAVSAAHAIPKLLPGR
jgi:hypothetical protein